MYKITIDTFWARGLGVAYVRNLETGQESRAWIVRDEELAGIPYEQDGILNGEFDGDSIYDLFPAVRYLPADGEAVLRCEETIA